MSLVKPLAIAALAASTLAPIAAHAEEVKPVACTVTVDYLVNSVLRSTYTKDFVVTPGTTFSDDFSTFTRFGFFDAWTGLDASGKTTVSISFYRDVGVFDYIDLRTGLTLRDGKSESTSGQSSYFTSLAPAGEKTTRYALSCNRQ